MIKYRKITDISLVTDMISIYLTRSPASAGIANRTLVFLGIFFNFRTRMMKLGVQVAKGCHFHVVKTE